MNSVRVQKSHYLSSYKKLLFHEPYSEKSILNGKKLIFICKNSVKMPNFHKSG